MRRTHLASDFGIGEALSDYVRGNVLETKSIVSQFPEVEAEHLLIQVAEKVEGFHAHIGSLDSALEETPEVLKSVSVNLPVNVLLGMVDYLMLEILVLQSLIGEKRIGIDRAACLDVTPNLGLKMMLAASGNHHCANFAAAFKDAHDGSLVLYAALGNHALVFVGVHEAARAADEGFVYFYLGAASSKFRGRVALHRKADSVEHEPCGLLSDAKSAGHFVGTDTVLAVSNHPNSDEPLVQRKRGILKDSPDLHGELPLSMDALALPLALILEEHSVLTATGRASHLAVRPAQLNHELEAVVRVREVNDGLLEGLWFAHVSHLNQGYPKAVDLSSILLPAQVLNVGGLRGKD